MASDEPLAKIDLLAPAKGKAAFARNQGISKPTLDKLIRLGRGPRFTYLLGKLVVMPEDELAWRREQRDNIDEDQRAMVERKTEHCRRIASKAGRKRKN